VVITRPRAQGLLELELRRLGAEVVRLPTVDHAPPPDPQPLESALRELETMDWIVFTSANAVEAVAGHPAWTRVRRRPRIAAVGPATEARLRRAGLVADLTPPSAGAAELARALSDRVGLGGLRILWPRSEIALPELPEALRRGGATVLDPVAYRTVPARIDAAAFLRDLERGRFDAILFLSPSAAEGLAIGLGANLESLAGHTLVASLGPSTTAALRRLGAPPAVESAARTVEDLARIVIARLMSTDVAPRR
jgi:uroporphyrinogen III methyltransferase/synthase